MIAKWPELIPKMSDRDKMNLYWFWEKYIIYKSRNTNLDAITRITKQFNIMLDMTIIKKETEMGQKGKWNGQSKGEFDKNYNRIRDIVSKSAGDKDKEIKLSETQANRIFDEHKAINRAMAAKEMGHENIFEVFFQRAFELGSVSKQDYRNYKLEQLGIL